MTTFGAFQGRSGVMGDLHGIRQFVAGEIELVLAVAANGFRQRGVAHPQRNLVRLVRAGEHDGQRRAPASAAKYGDALHGASCFFAERKFRLVSLDQSLNVRVVLIDNQAAPRPASQT